MVPQLGTIDGVLREIIAGNNFLIVTLGALALSVAGLLACYLPARRASRVDPAVVPRAE